MENSTNMKELLDIYYRGFAQKKDWESVIAEDFRFTGGDMTQTTPVIGKNAYIQIISRFSQVFESMRVKNTVIQGNSACIIGNYDYQFPNGTKIKGDVAEIWEAKDGKLSALTIFFDTLTFDKNTPKG